MRSVRFEFGAGAGAEVGTAACGVAIGAGGGVIGGGGDAGGGALGAAIGAQWSLATALSLLTWYIFAPQCVSTLGVVKRETNSWRWPIVMFGYMLALAWLASFAVYQTAIVMGMG